MEWRYVGVQYVVVQYVGEAGSQTAELIDERLALTSYVYMFYEWNRCSQIRLKNYLGDYSQ